jgi:hypothetical protein
MEASVLPNFYETNIILKIMRRISIPIIIPKKKNLATIKTFTTTTMN